MHSHMTRNWLYPELQSSYRQHHSMETAMLKVINDILLIMNSRQVTLMVLLDLSTAFNTVNHDIRLDRHDKVIGMHGVTLDCFVDIFLINANKSVVMDFCLIDTILNVVYLRGPV